MSDADKVNEDIETDKDLQTADSKEPDQGKADTNWDEAKQRVDQAEANVRKLSEKLELVASEKQAYEERIAAMEQSLSQKETEKDLGLEGLDEDLVGSGVGRNFEKLAAELRDTRTKLIALETKAAAYDEQIEESKEQQRKREQEEKILAPLDKKFGPKYRSLAIELANKKISDGKVKWPDDALDARDLMESSYQEIYDKEQAKQVKSKPTATDTGDGGIPWDGSGKKTGTLDSVMADVRKKGIMDLLK